MWRRRLKETVAVITIGDGAIELIAPRQHFLLWEAGPESTRRLARFFAGNPNYMRVLGATQIAFGVCLALRQYRGE
jgi:hypothetical protein